MTIKRINFTGRKRIARRHVNVRLQATSSSLTFDVAVDLSDYDLPDAAVVFVEAYRHAAMMRFPFGTVAGPGRVPGVDYTLRSFDEAEGILFRIKVTSSEGRTGLLLAEGDKLRPADMESQTDKRQSLLPIVRAPLRDQVWDLDFGDGGVVLRVNQSLGDHRAVAGAPGFRALVYPEVLRRVLEHILRREAFSEVDDLSDWRAQWLSFGKRLCGAPPPSVEDSVPGDVSNDVDEWIEDVVARFASRFTFADSYLQTLDGVAIP